MPLGLRFLNSSFALEADTPLLDLLTAWISDRDHALLAVIIVAMLVGQLKGRTILAKAAGREISRIRLLSDPASITQLYSGRFYILVAVMMCLGISMKVFNVPLDVRGGIDLMVGIALIQGSLSYFKAMNHEKATA
jgi:hypothetical protein